jgi:uncharacterized protein (DUF433 family)
MVTDTPKYTERYPEVRGRVLWCVQCGEDCAAENLDWGQHCPRCALWWRENPPPSDDLAGALRRLAALAGGVVWPTEDGIESGPSGRHWWPCFAGTDIAADIVMEEGYEEDAAILAAYPLLTAEQVAAARAYCARHIDLRVARNWLDWMENGQFGEQSDDVELLRGDVRRLCAELAWLQARDAEVTRFATEAFSGADRRAIDASRGAAAFRLFGRLEAIDDAHRAARGLKVWVPGERASSAIDLPEETGEGAGANGDAG